MSYTKAIIIGNLTRDPELRFTPGGSAVCALAVAVNRKWTKDGKDMEEVSFFDVEAWGKTAENIAKYFTKGKPIFIDGRLKEEKWDDKATGAKRSKIKVVAESFQFIGGDAPAAKRETASTPPTQPANNQGAPAEDDSSVPF